jgi:hypothetical protein
MALVTFFEVLLLPLEYEVRGTCFNSKTMFALVNYSLTSLLAVLQDCDNRRQRCQSKIGCVEPSFKGLRLKAVP